MTTKMNINITRIVPNQLLSRFGVPIKEAKEASLGTFFLRLHFSFFYHRQNTTTSPTHKVNNFVTIRFSQHQNPTL